ncbi:MAG TPA: hypothetical protein VGJ33_07875 [Candidatus Angelobacter sp.]
MLAKCANPSCSTPLVYLREGKIFMIEGPGQLNVTNSPSAPKSPNRVEHFWLCGPCSSQMTVTSDRKRGVQVVPKSARAFRAAAS